MFSKSMQEVLDILEDIRRGRTVERKQALANQAQPRTAAGRRLLAGPNMRRALLSDILAIEAEAAVSAPTPAEPLNTILQAIVQHCSDANMTFDDLRVLNRLIEKVEQAAAPTPAEPLDECPCGHDENEHVHYCSAITDDGQSCGCVQNYVRLAAARSDTPAEPERIPSSDSEAWNEKDGHRAWLAESEGLTDPEGHGIVDHHAAQEEEGVTRKTGRSTTV